MKLNKVKLTAMAMSVMMAMSSMSAVTFAEENVTEAATETVTEATVDAQAEEVAEETVAANPPVAAKEFEKLVVTDIWNNTVVVVWSDGSTTAPLSQSVSVTKATCNSLEKRTYTVEYAEGLKEAITVEVPGTILTDHQWGEIYKEVIVAAGCENKGLTVESRKCAVCGKVEELRRYEIEPEGHSVSSWSFIKYLVAGDKYDGEEVDAVNTKLVNGQPALIDTTKEGFYIKVSEGVCTKCGKNDTKLERVRIEAEQISRTEVKNTVNIDEAKTAAAFGKNSFADVTADMLKASPNLIVFKDCLKAGSYQVYYYYQTNINNPRIETVTIDAPHHSEVKTVKFINPADALKCTVTGTTVVNNTCNEDIRYYINTKCRNCNMDRNSEEMIAKPQGPHKVDQSVKKYMDTHITDGILDSYEGMMTWLKANNKSQYVSVETTATCTENGTTTVTLLCTTCKEPTDTVYTAKTDMFNHYSITKNAVVEMKESTCEEKGYIISADKCDLCGKELSNRVKKEVKRLAHTNEIGINDNGTSQGTKTVLDGTTTVELVGDVLVDTNGETLKLNGQFITPNQLVKIASGTLAVKVYNNCSTCGNNKQDITAAQALTMKITSIKKETELKAGSITLDVQVEGVDAKGQKKVISKQFTADYFTNAVSYLDRKDTLKLNGLHLEDGKFNYYKDGVIDTTFKGLVDYNGSLFYVENGTVATGVNGAKLINNKWYFLAYGMVQTQYVGLTTYQGKAFYVQNGIIDTNVGGLVEFDGRKFAVASGRIIDEYSGLWQDPASEKWYYLVRGQVTDKTTLVLYDGAWFYVIDGRLASDFTGTVNYDGAKFNVVKGQVYGQA